MKKKAVSEISPMQAAGFDVELYRELNLDLKDMPESELIEHFVLHGIPEGRSHTRKSNFNLHVDTIVCTKHFIAAYGWSEEPGNGICALAKFNAEDAKPVTLRGAVIRYWRNDVAQHLGVPVRTTRNGFVALFRAEGYDDLKSIALYQSGIIQNYTGAMPRPVDTGNALLEIYRHLESSMVYDELLLILSDSREFLEGVANFHRKAIDSVATHLIHWPKVIESPQLSICAVALGNAAQLKTWLMNVHSKFPTKTTEVVLLCNGPIEFDWVKSVAVWGEKVLGLTVRLAFTGSNIGFNHAVNRLVGLASGEYLLITNTDVQYREFNFQQLKKLCAYPSICIARQFNGAGALQHLALNVTSEKRVVHGECFESISTSLVGRNTFEGTSEADVEVDYFGAAAFFGKKNVLLTLGPFDPGVLYAYHEDTELAVRARRNGVRLVVTHALDITHYESSAAQVNLPKAFLIAANTTKVAAVLRENNVK